MPANQGPLAELRAAGSGVTGLVADLLLTRLELLGLETREAAIRLVQAVLLASLGGGLVATGLGLAIAAALLAVPPQWRAAAAAGGAVAVLIAAVLLLTRLRSRLSRTPGPFAASIEEIKKDKACF